jgi:7,8-dihydropterin-6-yl-methyl-4-(beta-D-ribofuranosyl)aminobenzene 5'-phosphate synthase
MTPIELEPVDRLRVTILMDNVTDVLIPDQGPVTRFSAPKALADSAPRVPARFSAEGVPDAMIAEHGFSALVRVEKDGRERTLLFDTGVSPTGMVENMRRLGLSLRDVEVIVLSHGHWDHVTGMEGVARTLGARRAAGDDSPGVLESAQNLLSGARPGRAPFDEPHRTRGSRL